MGRICFYHQPYPASRFRTYLDEQSLPSHLCRIQYFFYCGTPVFHANPIRWVPTGKYSVQICLQQNNGLPLYEVKWVVSNECFVM